MTIEDMARLLFERIEEACHQDEPLRIGVHASGMSFMGDHPDLAAVVSLDDAVPWLVRHGWIRVQKTGETRQAYGHECYGVPVSELLPA